MTQRTARIWEECRSWPDEERAELADQLLQSLESDDDVQAAWDQEIADRLKSIDDGSERCVPSEEVHRGIRKIINDHRVSSPSAP